MRGVALWLALIAPAFAGEVLDVGIAQVDRRYSVEIDMRIAAPAERVRALLTDYPQLGRVNDSIYRSEVLAMLGPQRHRVRTEARICVALVCKDITQVQEIAVLPDGSIVATVQPEASDFSYGVARWQFWPEPTGTRLRFRSEIEPAFWVPPLIGPWLIRRALHDEALKSAANLERLAEGVQSSP